MKKGELTSFQIVSLVILIISFLVLLGFLFLPDLIGQSEEEVCRISILERATLPKVAQGFAPIKCRTEKICFSLNGEDCLSMRGEEVRKINLPKDFSGAANSIEKITAEEMYDCWSITGKGRLNLFSGDKDANVAGNIFTSATTVREAHAKCIICSRLALSETVKATPQIKNQIDLYDYLKTEKVPGTADTFLETFTDKQVQSYPNEFLTEIGKTGNRKTSDGQVAIIFSQILIDRTEASEAGLDTGITAGLMVGGAILGTTGIVSLPTTGVISSVVALYAGVSAYFQTTTNQAAAATYCGRFAGAQGDEAQYGCSVVTTVDYNDINTINELCQGGIEGII